MAQLLPQPSGIYWWTYPRIAFGADDGLVLAANIGADLITKLDPGGDTEWVVGGDTMQMDAVAVAGDGSIVIGQGNYYKSYAADGTEQWWA